jgi:ankyrin repeat protein
LKAPNLDVNAENDTHDTALTMALNGLYDTSVEHAEFVKALPEIIEGLLKKGANPNKQDQFGQLPLIQAIYANRPDVVRSLLASGADKNLRDKNGQTAVSITKIMGYKEIEELLK